MLNTCRYRKFNFIAWFVTALRMSQYTEIICSTTDQIFHQIRCIKRTNLATIQCLPLSIRTIFYRVMLNERCTFEWLLPWYQKTISQLSNSHITRLTRLRTYSIFGERRQFSLENNLQQKTGTNSMKINENKREEKDIGLFVVCLKWNQAIYILAFVSDKQPLNTCYTRYWVKLCTFKWETPTKEETAHKTSTKHLNGSHCCAHRIFKVKIVLRTIKRKEGFASIY